MSSQVRYRVRASPPRYPTARSPNAARTAAAVAGSGSASGTSTTADRPEARQALTASTQAAPSRAGSGRTQDTVPASRAGLHGPAPDAWGADLAAAASAP